LIKKLEKKGTGLDERGGKTISSNEKTITKKGLKPAAHNQCEHGEEQNGAKEGSGTNEKKQRSKRKKK